MQNAREKAGSTPELESHGQSRMFSISKSGRHWRGSCARGRALGWVALLMAVLAPAGEQPLVVLCQVHPWMSLLPSPPGQLSPAAGPLLPGSA